MSLNQKNIVQVSQGDPLEGMEGLLEQAHVEVVDDSEKTEAQLIRQALNQLGSVTELIRDTTERLATARQRLSTLTHLVQVQEKQMQLFVQYEAQAARADSLENQLEMAQAELAHLKRPLSQKLKFWSK
jgi:chromosome segregation ATPase